MVAFDQRSLALAAALAAAAVAAAGATADALATTAVVYALALCSLAALVHGALLPWLLHVDWRRVKARSSMVRTPPQRWVVAALNALLGMLPRPLRPRPLNADRLLGDALRSLQRGFLRDVDDARALQPYWAAAERVVAVLDATTLTDDHTRDHERASSDADADADADIVQRATIMSDDLDIVLGGGRPAYVHLAHACRCVEREHRLSPFGRIVASESFSRALRDNARMAAFFARYPTIAERRVPPCIVIAGLARTGTTLLQRLLSLDPRMRTLHTWESMELAPHDWFAWRRRGARDSRIAVAETAAASMRYLVPHVYAAHPVDAHAPDEELGPMNHTMRSQLTAALYASHAWVAYIRRQPVAPMYAHLYRCLQFLLWQDEQRDDANDPRARRRRRREQLHLTTPSSPTTTNTTNTTTNNNNTNTTTNTTTTAHSSSPSTPSFMLLKTPNHLAHLDALLASPLGRAGGVRVVFTHRDVLRCVPSLLSLVSHIAGLTSSTPDVDTLVADWLDEIESMMRCALATRRAEPPAQRSHRFHDVAYDDLVREPLDVVARLYAWLGVDLTDDVERRMRAALNDELANKQRFGTHSYDLADFSLTDVELCRRFAFYTDAPEVRDALRVGGDSNART